MDFYSYDPIHINPESIEGNWSMVEFRPLNTDCSDISQSKTCNALKSFDCGWCSFKEQCLAELELRRPEHHCQDEIEVRNSKC